MKQSLHETIDVARNEGNGKRILFASVPADGHVNPLTGVAVYLKSIGYEVRWYTSEQYAEKINGLYIHHYPFVKALNINIDNFNELLPGREKAKSAVAKLNFDLEHFFIMRGSEYYEDIIDIYQEFPFDLLIADCAFTGLPFVQQKMNIPTIAMGIMPLMEKSKDLPPYGLGMVPSFSVVGKIKQSVLRWAADAILFKKSNKVLERVALKHGLSYEGQNVFDYVVKKSSMLLQSATPGFEYYRSDISSNVRFIGALLPYKKQSLKAPWFDERLNQYDRIILLTQGTAEKDVTKLIIPTLEAFKDTDTLVVVTTAGSQTKELRKQYAYPNIIIEDFIPFSDVMPYADVYVTNGGYGGVMLGIENELPMVVAGVHEGKSEICARVGYFELGINLKTERPKENQIKRAVEEIFRNKKYKYQVQKLAAEFNQYDPNALVAKYVGELIKANKKSTLPALQGEPIF